jgi:hypothetical protein
VSAIVGGISGGLIIIIIICITVYLRSKYIRRDGINPNDGNVQNIRDDGDD